MKKLLSLLLCMAMVLSMAACGSDPEETTAATAPSKTETSPATGVPFTVIITDLDGTVNTFTYTSDAATVGEALIDEGLVVAEQTEYGLYIESVNGITADWTTENAYWAFFVDGAYPKTGLDTTAITEGAVYALTKTISYTPLGEGSVTFYLVVRDLDGAASSFRISTDAATVGEALLALELIQMGSDGQRINTVNGITADQKTEKATWVFYADGEPAQTGVNATTVQAGTTYELIKTAS